MTRERISQAVAALIVVLSIVGAADPEMVPKDVARWALLGVAIVQGIAGAFGFNTGTRKAAEATTGAALPRYQRHDK
jgi:hypothetical protein